MDRRRRTLNVPRYDGDGTLFAIDRGGSRVYVATDHLGSPRLITDAAGTTVRTIEYDAFGKVTGGTRQLRPADRLRGRAVRSGDGPGALRQARLRARVRTLDRRGPDLLRGQPGQPVRVRRLGPDDAHGPHRPGVRRVQRLRGLGGGIQFCRDNSIDNADWSLCADFGVGLGGGWDVDLAGGAAETGGAIVAEATWKAGIGGGTLGGELDLDCLNFKGSAKAQYGPVAVGMDSTGSPSLGYASPEVHIAGELQGKIAYKRCAKW